MTTPVAFTAHLQSFLESMKVLGYSPQTIKNYRSAVELFFAYLGSVGIANLLQIGSGTLRQYQHWLRHARQAIHCFDPAVVLRGERPTINGTGEQERDFVYVGDVARANLAAMQDDHNTIYNIGSAIGTNVNTIYRELAEIVGVSSEPLYGPAKLGEVYKIYLDASKAKSELGWEPKVSLKEGLRRTVDYFRIRLVNP